MTSYGLVSSGNDYGTLANGELRASTYNKLGSNLWAYQMRIYAAKDPGSGNVTTRLAVYETSGSKNPTTRIGYTNSFTVSNTGDYAAAMQSKTASFAWSNGPSAGAVPMSSGKRYALAVLGTGGNLNHRMRQAAQNSGADENRMFYKYGQSQPPASSYSGYSSSYEGWLTISIDGDINVAPNTPSGLAPAGTINNATPTFAATFSDNNENRGDYLNQCKIQVRRVSDGAVFWDTTITATSGERSTKAISRTYGGTALVRGTSYEWRCQMSDYFGAWSSWTAWTAFVPANLGYITLDGDPAGKILTVTPDFDGKWTHQSGDDMTHAQVRILGQSGNVLQIGAEYDIADVTSSAAPGTAFTVDWSDTGLSALVWGASYSYQIRGKDQTGIWSDWSDARSFSTNAAPSIPSQLAPADGTILTSYPKLICRATDPDDTPGGTLAVFARIKDASGSVLYTRAMSYNATTLQWEYQTDGTDLASYATYRWDAYSYDGTLYSGEQTTSGAAIKSAEATFVYALGPTVSVDNWTDGDTVTTASMQVDWTTSDQVKYRVTLLDVATGSLVYDTGVVISAAGTHTIPSGYYHTGQSYQLVVWVEDSTPLSGESSVIGLTIAYTEPDAITGFRAVPIGIGDDPNGWTTAIELSWEATSYGTETWQRYEITRIAASGKDRTAILWRRITAPSQVSVIDYVPACGVEYTYTIRQVLLQGLDELASEAVTAAATAQFGGVVLSSVAHPDSLRVALRYTTERPHARDIVETVYHPLSGDAPVGVRARNYEWSAEFEAQLWTDEWSTADDKRLALEELDATLGTICYRDDRGRKQFCALIKCGITDQVPAWYEATIGMRVEGYQEGPDL